MKLTAHIIAACCGLALLLGVSACSKDQSQFNPGPTVGSGSPQPNALVLKDRVFVLDTVQYHLISSAALLKAGTYTFRSAGAVPAFKAGDVILGAQGRGFLRKVIAVSAPAGQIIFQTTQASMQDAFKSGTLDLSTDMDGLHRGASSTAWSIVLPSQTLYQNGPLTLSLTRGQIDMNPNWNVALEFDDTGLLHFLMAARGGNLTGNFTVNTSARQAVTLVNRTSTLKHVSKTYTKWVAVAGIPVPIVVEMDLDLDLQYGATLDAAITRDATFTTASTFDLGVEYSNQQWQGIYALTPTNTFALGPRSGNANGGITLALVPRVSFKFYDVAGPYASVGLQEELKAGAASPARDWDFQADVWLHSEVGADVTILGNSLANYSKAWDTAKLTYTTPERLERTSGDNQTGQPNNALPQPLRVQVLDSKGAPQSSVPVYFTPNVENGSVAPATMLTDATGYAQAIWTLGASTTTIQYVNVTAKKAKGQPIINAPLDFAATASAPTCLPVAAPAMQLLTGGSTKIWKLIDQKGYGSTATIFNGCASVSGTWPTYTFSSNGMSNCQFLYLGHIGNVCSWRNGDMQVSNSPFCMPTATSLQIKQVALSGNYINDQAYTIDKLTASSLVLKWTNDHDPTDMEVLTFQP